MKYWIHKNCAFNVCSNCLVFRQSKVSQSLFFKKISILIEEKRRRERLDSFWNWTRRRRVACACGCFQKKALRKSFEASLLTQLLFWSTLSDLFIELQLRQVQRFECSTVKNAMLYRRFTSRDLCWAEWCFLLTFLHDLWHVELAMSL